MTQNFVHYFLHFIFIGAIAYGYDKTRWKKYWLVLLATMLVDLDHLLATPIFHPGRCSIGFHVLHSQYMIPLYFLGALLIKHRMLRLVMIGLAFHMITDFLDCLWMFSKCEECGVSEIFSYFSE
jgi:hypothetical protein